MAAASVCEQIRESLNGRPGQPIVLGVCQSLAERFAPEPWVFRLAAIILTLCFTLPALAVYVILGFVLTETKDRTRQFFSGLGIIARENIEKLAASLRGIIGTTDGHRM